MRSAARLAATRRPSHRYATRGRPLGARRYRYSARDDEDVLYLFFPETAEAREAGLASLQRLNTRLSESHASVSAQAGQAQLAAVTSFGTGVWDRLPELGMPVLVANGAHDVMINAFASCAMSQRLPNAKVVFFSDAGHGFLFQHHATFAREVLEFLDDRGKRS